MRLDLVRELRKDFKVIRTIYCTGESQKQIVVLVHFWSGMKCPSLPQSPRTTATLASFQDNRSIHPSMPVVSVQFPPFIRNRKSMC